MGEVVEERNDVMILRNVFVFFESGDLKYVNVVLFVCLVGLIFGFWGYNLFIC